MAEAGQAGKEQASSQQVWLLRDACSKCWADSPNLPQTNPWPLKRGHQS